MNTEIKNKIIELAKKYENDDFIIKDPVSFLHQYNTQSDAEIAAFIAASLSYGRRDQILKHAKLIFDQCGTNKGELTKWVREGKFLPLFPDNSKSFYRVFTNSQMRKFFLRLQLILNKEESMGEYFKKLYQENQKQDKNVELFELVKNEFPEMAPLIPKTDDSACKRINMFLRWMVRENSPVDSGYWNWYPKERLLMPMDVHVIREATNLGLLPKTSSGKLLGATLKTCRILTEQMKLIWPEDPLKGDFALFGLGVDEANKI